MIRVSLRNLLAGKLRLALTLAAVMVGVSFVSGAFVLSDTMGKAFDELYAGLTSGTDVVVKSRPAIDADITTTGGQLRPLHESLVQKVAAVPGVRVADGSVSGFAVILDKHGDPIQPGGAPTLGVSIGDSRLAGDFTYRAGQGPIGPGEVAIDARTVKQAGFHLGDPVQVVLLHGQQTFHLVGIIGFGESDSLLGATLAGFDLTTAQRVLDKVGMVDESDVQGDAGISAEELRQRIGAVLPQSAEALTGQQVAADGSRAVRDAMGIFTTVLLVFAGISVLVGSFVIWNTFNVLVAQRRREVALLRAVGATRRQVLTGVLAEATVIGLVSGVLGLLLGVGLAAGIRALLTTIGVEMPTTSPAVEARTVVAALLVGLVVTIGAATVPAWSATRVSPVEALRDAATSSDSLGRLRAVLGWTLLGAGASVLAVCMVVGDQRWWTVIGTLTVFAGIVAVGPLLARATAALADHGWAGSGWRMAARNIARSPRRAAASAMALTIGLTVVAAVAVTSASLRDSVAEAVAGGNRSDLILEPAGAGLGVSPGVPRLLRNRADVADVVELRETGGEVDGHAALVSALDTDGLERVLDLGLVHGSVSALRPGTVLVSTTRAADLGVAPGDTVTVTFAETGDVPMRVAGTFDKGALINASYIVSMPDFAANVTSELDAAVLVKMADGRADGRAVSGAKATIQSALAAYPNVTVNTPDDITKEAQKSVNQLLGIVTALLLLAVVVALLGIVNTLVLSVMERTRELGLLRAVGATRHQVRVVVRRESVLTALLGAVTGLALGAVSGIALSRALAEQGVTTVAVPWVTLAIYLLVATGVGILAAVGPARRASRVDVLRAITSE
jgi:putative ABC transport system permease protein